MAKKAKATTGSAVNTKEESKSDRFKRIAGLRVNNALKAVGLVGNLGGAQYEYTQGQVDKICTALLDEVGLMQKKLMREEGALKKFSL